VTPQPVHTPTKTPGVKERSGVGTVHRLGALLSQSMTSNKARINMEEQGGPGQGEAATLEKEKVPRPPLASMARVRGQRPSQNPIWPYSPPRSRAKR